MPKLSPYDLDHILAHTPDVWRTLDGKRIFLTGGTGFFGTWLVESLCWAVDKLGIRPQVTLLTRNPAAFATKAPHLAEHPAVRLYQGDIRDFSFPRERFPYVIHAATEATAFSHPGNAWYMWDSIVQGTQRVLEFTRSCEAERLLLTSSGAVYGRQPSVMTHVPENFSGAPLLEPTERVAYAEGKRAAETMAALWGTQHDVICPIARCFAFVGPHLPLDQHFAVGNFMGNLLRDEPIQINGDGTPHRSYLHAADLAIWLWTILLCGEHARTYNVGSDESVSIEELARTLCRVAWKSEHPIEIAGVPVPGMLPERYVPDTSRAREELGLDVFIPLEAALRRTLAWHRAYPPQAALELSTNGVTHAG